MRDKAQDLQQAMSEAKSTAVSDEGEVTVTVNVSGGLEDLQLDREVRHLHAETLRTLILDTYRRAAEQSGEQMDAVMERVLGADAETMSVYRDARQRYGG